MGDMWERVMDIIGYPIAAYLQTWMMDGVMHMSLFTTDQWLLFTYRSMFRSDRSSISRPNEDCCHLSIATLFPLHQFILFSPVSLSGSEKLGKINLKLCLEKSLQIALGSGK